MRSSSIAIVALWLLAAAGGAGAQELGRLFFTPEQRDALDARRKARVPDKPAAVIASPTTRLDGYVMRSGGKSTVWVNGESIVEGAQPEGMRVQPARGDPSRATVTIGETETRIPLRVGETLDRGSGEVRDVIGDGEIEVRRGAKRR